MGGSKQTSTSVSGSAQKWAQPYATAAANQVASVYNANAPGLQQLSQTVTGMLPGLQQQYSQGSQTIDAASQQLSGMLPGLVQRQGQNAARIGALTDSVQGMLPGLMSRVGSTDSSINAARGYTSDVLSGKYLNGNPYLDAVLQRTRSNVADDVNSQFTAAGRYGSGAHTGVLTDRLADAEMNARMSDYNTQMGRMDSAASLSPTLATAQGQLDQSNLSNALSATNTIPALTQAGYTGLNETLQTAGALTGLNEAQYSGLPQILSTAAAGAEMPYTGINSYSNSLGALFNGGTQTSTQKSGGFLSGLGSVLSGGAAVFSDRRLKRDVVKVGELPDGLGVYEYTYLWGEPSRGVMADEVAQLRPWALGPEIEGYQTVDYSKLEIAA